MRRGLLFLASTIRGIDLFYHSRTDVPEDEEPYDYYPVDSVNDLGQVEAFEWDPRMKLIGREPTGAITQEQPPTMTLKTTI